MTMPWSIACSSAVRHLGHTVPDGLSSASSTSARHPLETPDEDGLVAAGPVGKRARGALAVVGGLGVAVDQQIDQLNGVGGQRVPERGHRLGPLVERRSRRGRRPATDAP